MSEELQIRIHGDAARPTLIYLPGAHGDWTLVQAFRVEVSRWARWVEFTYPRTVEWSLRDYAAGIQAALAGKGINRGWLVGESFGSQVAWALLESSQAPFQAEGVILSGGFVKYPFRWGPLYMKRSGERTSMEQYHKSVLVYARYLRWRHRRSPEALAGIDEFLARRTDADRRAIRHRLQLIADNNPEEIARRTTIPVYYLGGLIDPLVPVPLVRSWLSRNCPGYGGGRTILSGDHNVLGTAPEKSSRQIRRWIERERK